MKRFTTVVMMLVMAIFITSFSLSAEEGTADLTIHYKNWSGDYTGLGTHGWDATEPRETFDGEDDFGVYFTFESIDITKLAPFIAVTWEDGAQNWDKKETQNVEIPANTFKAGVHHHVYVFEGAETSPDNPGYYIASNDHQNLLLVYADPSGVYDAALGIHAWGWSNVPDQGSWGTPAKVFTDGAVHTAIPKIKVAMLQTENIADAGLIIYEGTDETKKTDDVKEDLMLELYGEDLTLGNVSVVYAYSKGNAYTNNDNLTSNYEEFESNAFTFRLLPMGKDAQNQFTGTYAPFPNQVIVSLSTLVASPLVTATTEDEIDDAVAEVISWFTVKEANGTTLAIEDVHFDRNADSIKDFVVLLESEFDTTKDYIVEFDLGLVGDDNRQSEIEIDLDKNAPEITFASPSEVVGVPENERIIFVEWNKKFPAAKFPSFIVNDDRDGDISHLVYVPAGENSTINTNVEGDYKIMLRVEDRWGNLTEETFIFRVTRNLP